MEIATFVYLDQDVDDRYIEKIVENIRMIQELADIKADIFVEKDVTPQVEGKDGIFPYFENRKFHDRYCLQMCYRWEECTAFYATRFKKRHDNIVDYCPFGLHVLAAGIEIDGKCKGVLASEAFLTETPTKEFLEEHTQLKREMVPYLPNHHLTRLKTFYDILGSQLENALSIGHLRAQLETEKQSRLKFINTMNLITPGTKSNEESEIHAPKASEIIKDTLSYVHQNYLNKINLEHVAEIIHTNPQYLSRLFKREMEISYVDYLNILRIKYACKLLKETNYPIYRVASESGFSDAPYFTRVFNKHMGMLPGDFRKEESEVKT